MKIPITNERMLHDFAMTENYVIIPDLPMESNPEKVVRGERPWLWWFNKDGPCRYGVMKRHGEGPDEIQWFELPGHYVFHYGNSWEQFD